MSLRHSAMLRWWRHVVVTCALFVPGILTGQASILQSISSRYPKEKHGVLPGADEWGDRCAAVLPDSIALVADSLRSTSISVDTWQKAYLEPYWSIATHIHPRRAPADTLRVRVLAVNCDGDLLAQAGPYVFSVSQSTFRDDYQYSLRSFYGEPVVFILRDGVLQAAVALHDSKARPIIDEQSFVDSLARDSAQAVQAYRSKIRRAEDDRVSRVRAKRFSSEVTSALIARRLTIGMTPEMVRLAWGEPDAIKETVASAGKTEIWVYGYRTATLVNGKVTTFSTIR